MRRNMVSIVVITAIIAVIAVLFFQDQQKIGNQKGMIAENFTLPMHNQNEGELHDYFGDVIVLNMWASWCEPCRNEMPDFMQLQEDYGGKGLQVLTVNMRTTERKEQDVLDFIDEMGIQLPIFFDEEGHVSDGYQIIGLPTTYILDRDGEIKHLINGEVNYEMLEQLIEPLF